MFRCPVCGGRPARIYKCNHCDEIRCGLSSCLGSKRQHQGWAGANSQCRTCGEGRHVNVGFYSPEIDAYMRQQAEEQKRKAENASS
ncbi:MAG: hypothetical protein HQL53_05550 [Magnetococcales bacterium]|nr:hypothetical protein [Magnetococcales bacterium]